MLLCSTGACLQKLPCQGWTAAVFIKCFKSMPLAPFLFPRYGHPQLFVDLKLMVHHATTSQLLCLPQAFMPLLAKGAKDGNTPRYGRLASTELLVLMPLRCTLALTLHWHDTAATCPANHLARAIHHLTWLLMYHRTHQPQPLQGETISHSQHECQGGQHHRQSVGWMVQLQSQQNCFESAYQDYGH